MWTSPIEIGSVSEVQMKNQILWSYQHTTYQVSLQDGERAGFLQPHGPDNGCSVSSRLQTWLERWWQAYEEHTPLSESPGQLWPTWGVTSMVNNNIWVHCHLPSLPSFPLSCPSSLHPSLLLIPWPGPSPPVALLQDKSHPQLSVLHHCFTKFLVGHVIT